MDAIRQLLSHYRIGAVVLVTMLTLGLVGAVVLTTTSSGCGVANRAGLRLATCITSGPVAHVGQPSTTPGKGLPPPASSPSDNPSPQPYNPGASDNNPPYNPGASAYPPYNPGASAGNPYGGPASGSAPPLPHAASGSVPPGVAVSCRLPVFAGGPGSGGFIVFPGQNFIADPRSAVSAPSPSPGSASPTPPPQYGPGWPTGFYGLTYDAGYAKWLPVPYAWVSPDGKHYAYPLGGDIYVQNVASGTQLDLAEGKGFWVLDAENDGVYVTTPNQPGLWFLSYAGTTSQLTNLGFWQAVGGGAAYGTPTSSVPQGASNTIQKLVLSTGSITDFFTQPNAQSTVTGFDGQGHPVIQVYYPGSQNVPGGQAIFIATAAGAIPIATMTYGPYTPPFPSGTPIADSHGLWFSVGGGVVLFTNNAWYWMASIGGQLAGQCL